jgi:hypothetical protein
MVKPPPHEKLGVILGVTVTVSVAGTAHSPAVGVNVYVPLFWLSTVAGLQVPVTPLSEVPDKVGAVPPLHKFTLVPKLKVGVTLGFTVTVTDAGTAHCPAVGVNV